MTSAPATFPPRGWNSWDCFGGSVTEADDVLYPPIRRADICMIRRAITRCGRAMTLSLSPGRELSLEHAEFLHEHAEMWRVSDDLWDDWRSVVEQFQRAARWARTQRDDGVGDLDMLPLGRIGIRAHVGEPRDSLLSLDEQRSVLTLWSIARSPLMMGGHLPESCPQTIALLQADAVLALGERGTDCREIIRDQDLVVWRTTLRPPAGRQEAARQVRAVFNLGSTPRTRRLHMTDLGLEASTDLLTDLWTGRPVTIVDGWWEMSLPAHGCVVAASC